MANGTKGTNEMNIMKLLKLKPQARKVLNHLTKRKSISPLEALHVYGIYRLAASIHELRKIGIQINTVMKADASGHHYARYEVAA
jgi:hypothetical protein